MKVVTSNVWNNEDEVTEVCKILPQSWYEMKKKEVIVKACQDPDR